MTNPLDLKKSCVADISQGPNVDLGELLDSVYRYLGKFVAYPDESTQIAHTLWIAHTHPMQAWESTPRIAFLSPEPGSGKTRAIEITETLVPRPVEAVNVTPAYLFRKVGDESGSPTILYDEIDTVFGPKAKENEEIRGLLNAGHRRGAVAGRCVTAGQTVKTEEIPAYCAVALAGLGDLPDTILSRSIIVRMRRRAPGETVEPYRRRVHASEGHLIREGLESWAFANVETLKDAYPEMPGGVVDRDADIWEPLLAVADAAGGDWPEKARVSAVTLVTGAKQRPPSLGVRLLSDLRVIFKDNPAMFTEDILAALNNDSELPWGDLRGQPMDSRKLSTMLRKYLEHLTPEERSQRQNPIRIGEKVARGYKAEWLHDPWSRYLPPLEDTVTSVTPVTSVPESRFKLTDCPRCGGEGCLHCEVAA